MKLQWSNVAARKLSKFQNNIADRITMKMEWFVVQDDPLSFADTLKNNRHGTHRFRIGDYRVFCEIRKNTMTILYVNTIRKRDHAYD